MITLNHIIKLLNPIECKKRLTHSSYLLHLIHRSWPEESIELIKANYSLRGVKAIIRDKADKQEYVLEIYPK